MTRVEALEEEIRKLTPEEFAEIREYLRKLDDSAQTDKPPANVKYTFADIRREIFSTPPAPHTEEELREGIEEAMREKHGSR